MQKSERTAVMAARSDSIFVIQDKTDLQSPGLMENFPEVGGSLSASNSETVDNYTMVCLEVTTAGVNRINFSSKIGEIGEIFLVRLEGIIFKVGTTGVSSGIKIGKVFTVRSSFQ